MNLKYLGELACVAYNKGTLMDAGLYGEAAKILVLV